MKGMVRIRIYNGCAVAVCPRPAQAPVSQNSRMNGEEVMLLRSYWQLTAAGGGRVSLFSSECSPQVTQAPANRPTPTYTLSTLNGLNRLKKKKEHTYELERDKRW